MKKVLNIVLKVVLSLILFMPILGALQVFPAPTPDLYNNPQAYEFIKLLMTSGYIPIINGIVFALALVLMWTKRMALMALLIFPITLNIFCFHLFLDGGMFTKGAVMANVLLLLNLYFLWQQRAHYLPLLKK